MLFGVRLSNEVYPPWKEDYIAYEKLKKLLKESVVLEGEEQEVWSEQDESRFVSTLDQELEKVFSFESKKYNELSERISKLEKLIGEDSSNSITENKVLQEDFDANSMEIELEDILEMATQLDRFSRLNYTGFLKIVKKHDRLHPMYQVKPLLHVRLNALPFHNEDYSPLLYRLSNLYNFLSDNFSASVTNNASARMSSFHENSNFQTFKFWVHSENVMEVKAKILRHLPVLVYNKEGKDDEDTDNSNTDPIITSLYFDNSSFDLYETELEKKKLSGGGSSSSDSAEPPPRSLRLRWYGKLQDRPDIVLERKDADHTQIRLKEKYIDRFLKGDSSVADKALKKLKDRKSSEAEMNSYISQVESLQNFVKDHRLSPVLRTIYTRTAFQIPGDDSVRVILDSDVQFIREDCFNKDRPIRDPDSWKRADLDIPGVDNDLSHIRKSEYTKFPYSILELRVKVGSSGSASLLQNSKHGAWVEELISSHLVKEVPQFSKFVQGIASLFAEDDRLDALPFWLPDLEHDIRRDPTDVYKEQRDRLLVQKDSTSHPGQRKIQKSSIETRGGAAEDDSSDNDTSQTRQHHHHNQIGYPAWSSPPGGPKLDMDSEDEEVVLPPGVAKPETLLRHQGQVKVETKVWLANERTFNKWLSVTTLLSAMTFALYNSVERSVSQEIAERVAYVLFALTLFSGIWGYTTYMQRLKYIKQRSERHLDSPFGPLVVAVTLFVALTVNFYFTLVNSVGFKDPEVNSTA